MLQRLKSMILRSRPAPAQDAHLDDKVQPLAYSARASFFDLAETKARRERLPLHLAMARLKVERPAEYRAAFPARRCSRRIAGQAQPMASRLLLAEQPV